MSNIFFGKPINGYDMGHTKHAQFFVLVHMQFVTRILSIIWDRI